MSWERYVTPLYQHLMHSEMATLGFIGIPLSIPCPIPYFEAQAIFLAEAWAGGGDLPPAAERTAWVEARRITVGARMQVPLVLWAHGWE
jgi:hypothetical protein